MWLCSGCHYFAEGVDRGLDRDLYLELKRKFTLEKCPSPTGNRLISRRGLRKTS